MTLPDPAKVTAAEGALLETIRKSALAKVTLERVRVDRSVVPAAVSDAAIAYRQSDAAVAEALTNLRELHETALRELGA